MGPMVKQLPISVGGAKKSDVRAQFAALCYRVVKDKVQVLVISSRGTGRWILPKGWPMDGKTPAEAALQEAWEEAGVIGKVVSAPLGLYSYQKVQDHAHDFPCIAVVYAVKVKSLSKDFPEAGERRVKWVGRKKAAKLVDEPELSQILRDFDPRKAA
jgi:8-oxo-dGTP pyrophosphatase MutT (NUDIX family)